MIFMGGKKKFSHFGGGGDAMFCSQNIWWDVSTIFAIFGGGTMSS